MAYVPQAEFDIFLSYAWTDDHTEWVNAFAKALAERLHLLLVEKRALWANIRQLSGEHVFQDEIKEQLEGSAALLVFSPTYFASKYCEEERAHFQRQVAGGPLAGNRLKTPKAIKLPNVHGLHEKLWKGAYGFSSHRDSVPHAREYQPGESAFSDRIDELARGAKALFQQMRNACLSLYLSESVAPPLAAAWRYLHNELPTHGFRLLPEFRATEWDFSPDGLLSAIEKLRCSLHRGKSAIVRLPPGGSADVKTEALLVEAVAAQSPATLLRHTELWQLKDIVLKAARAQAAPLGAPTAPARSSRSVYLICDRTDPADTAEALEPAGQLRSAVSEVHLPEVDRNPVILDQLHQQRLAESDAILLYLRRAPRAFLAENYRDLVRCLRRQRAQNPCRAVVLATPAPPASFPPGLAAYGSLGPFLAQSRESGW
jgi:hypothetical protein